MMNPQRNTFLSYFLFLFFCSATANEILVGIHLTLIIFGKQNIINMSEYAKDTTRTRITPKKRKENG